MITIIYIYIYIYIYSCPPSAPGPVAGATQLDPIPSNYGDYTNPPHSHKSDLNQFNKFKLQ